MSDTNAFQHLKPSTTLDVNVVGQAMIELMNRDGTTLPERKNILKKAAEIVIDSAEFCIEAKLPADPHMDFLRQNILRIFEQIVDIPPSDHSGMASYAALGLDVKKILHLAQRNHVNCVQYFYSNIEEMVAGGTAPSVIIDDIERRIAKAGGYEAVGLKESDIADLRDQYAPEVIVKGFVGDNMLQAESVPGGFVIKRADGGFLEGRIRVSVAIREPERPHGRKRRGASNTSKND